MCDDGIFSGSQMSNNIKTNLHGKKYSIHLIAPVITNIAKEKLNKIENININYYSKIDENIEENYKKNENIVLDDTEKKMRLYFDHKIPDSTSTFYYLYTNRKKDGIFLSVDNGKCLQTNSYIGNIFDSIKIRENALQFSKENFEFKLKTFVEEKWMEHLKKQ